jgi:hypothetical protein
MFSMAKQAMTPSKGQRESDSLFGGTDDDSLDGGASVNKNDGGRGTESCTNPNAAGGAIKCETP